MFSATYIESPCTLDEAPLPGFEWGNSSCLRFIVMFAWDRKRTSQKLDIEKSPDDDLFLHDGGSTIVVRDGAGFKNAYGDFVSS